MLYSEIHHIRLAVSYYCALNCKHCYVPEAMRKNYLQMEQEQLSVEEMKAFIDYLVRDFKLKKVHLTGGEALHEKVWPRTKTVIQRAFEHGLEVQLNTSGSGDVPITEILPVIKDNYDKFLFHISLDGVDEQKVDAFRGQKGAMKRAIHLLKASVENGINTRIRFTVTRDNIGDTVDCYKLGTELGVTAFMCKPMNIAGNAAKNNDLQISEAEVRELQLKLLQMSVNCKTRLDLPSPIFITEDQVPKNANAQISRCVCGVQLLYLAYNGDVYPCTYLAGAPNNQDYILGNIKDPAFNFRKEWLKPDTYEEFRNAEKHVCTAHKILNRIAVCS